jgi:hypothetical protein
MGDRVLFQVVRGAAEFGPVVYCHWAGARAPEIVRRLSARMLLHREGDIDYASARLVQECTAADPDGALSFGVSNAPARLTAEDSHGDAGVVLIDCDTFKCQCLGGYLETGADGFPEEAA